MLRSIVLLLLLALAGGAAWIGYKHLEARRLDGELASARRDIDGGRYSAARRRLRSLSEQHPSNGEVWFQLGLLDQRDGKFDEAIAAWRRIGRAHPRSIEASILTADEFVNTGRYTPAEELLEIALAHPGDQAYKIRRGLIRLYRFEGRIEDVRRQLRLAILESPDPAADLKELWLLDNSPMPVEALAEALDHADPLDPRVWLGKANLAILTGQLEDARRLLEQCEREAPSDEPIQYARLRWALEANDAEVARQALERLEREPWDEAEVEKLRAWIAQLSDDDRQLAENFQRLTRVDPGYAPAWEGLARLAGRQGREADSRQAHLKKTEIDRAKDQFRQLLLDGSLEASASELAALASSLGRTFESRAWSLLAQTSRQGWPSAALALEPLLEPSNARLTDILRSLRALEIRLAREAPRDPIPPAPTRPRFQEIAESAGLRFVFDHGASARRLLPETMSGGLAVLDADGDGCMDIYVVQGGLLHDDPTRPRESDRLFLNNQDGTFRDATETSGIASLPRGYGLGVAVGDIDNDGRSDLFISRLRSYGLLRNKGDGSFDDVTERWGLAGVRDNPTSAAFADLDNDGDLDLYVCHYMIYDPANPVQCQNERGEFFYCDPSKTQAAPDHLFRNDGGRFVDVTQEAGIVDIDGRGLGVVAADLDEDGKVDLYVANDGTANFFFRNLGSFRFEEVGLSSGVAGSAEGGYQASMGVALGDQDGDGLLDIVVTNFYGEASTLYHNLGGGLFTDWTIPSGLARATRYLLGFGTSFLDYDADGRLDLVTTNGHVNDNRPFYPYAMPAQLLAGTPDGRLVDVSKDAGDTWNTPLVGRGLAVADLDNDTRPDVLILPQGQPLRYLHNQTDVGNSIVLHLVGTKSNRDAIGAKAIVTAGHRTIHTTRFGGGSYQSSGDPRLIVGVGAAETATVEIIWPSGQVDRHEDVQVPAIYNLTEGGVLTPFGREEPSCAPSAASGP
jgi:tetratricopeptide (TPR) repeat protein